MFIPDLSLRQDVQHLFIRGLELKCMIGAYEHEKLKPQKILLECDVWVRTPSNIQDNLDNVLNYDLLVDTCKQVALSRHIALQETLVDEIATKLLQLPGIELVRVQSAKLEAYEDVNAAGVEIFRRPK